MLPFGIRFSGSDPPVIHTFPKIKNKPFVLCSNATLCKRQQTNLAVGWNPPLSAIVSDSNRQFRFCSCAFSLKRLIFCTQFYTGFCPVEQKVTFARVARQGGGALELQLGLGEAAELEEEVTANTGQEVVGLERRLRDERVHDLEARGGTGCHRDRDCAIQLNYG